MQVWIGTAGYSYEDWIGDFYPPETKPAQMLSRYCEVFPLVELNFTFYRPPTRSMLERLADKTPEGFQFLVKMPQTISHDESARDLPGFQHAVDWRGCRPMGGLRRVGVTGRCRLAPLLKCQRP